MTSHQRQALPLCNYIGGVAPSSPPAGVCVGKDDRLPLTSGARSKMPLSTVRGIFLTITITGLGVQGLAQAGQPGLPPVPQVAGVPTAAQQAAAQIDPERIRASVKYL